MRAAAKNGTVDDTRERVRRLVGSEPKGGFVRRILGSHLGLPPV
jgi:hypothetical protein